MTKILNFALKIKEGGREGGICEVLRPCYPPKKFGTCTSTGGKGCFSIRILSFACNVFILERISPKFGNFPKI